MLNYAFKLPGQQVPLVLTVSIQQDLSLSVTSAHNLMHSLTAKDKLLSI